MDCYKHKPARTLLETKLINLCSIFLAGLFSLALISCGGGSSDGNSLPPGPTTQPTGTITGIGFDGLLINSDVSVYDWSTGKAGVLLGTAKTNNNGLYSRDIVSPSTPILVKITNGSYFEEASGKQIQLDPDFGQQLTAVKNYISGQPITINTAFFSTLAHGLAESYVTANTLSVTNSIIEANKVMANWSGFNALTTIPLDVSNPINITTYANIKDGHNFGFVSAAISEATRRLHLDANVIAHSLWPSITFIQLAYQDIQDGKLDGKSNGTQLNLGTTNFNASIYRDMFATRLL